MEADWEVEIGGGAPIIDTHWPGFVDLRRHPEKAHDLPEAAHLPGLTYALIQLNGPNSPVWTSKCDVWQITDPAQFDPYELDTPPESAVHALACYIDLLPRSDQQWSIPENAVATARTICALLHPIPLRSCRADLLIRQAFIAPDPEDTGITAYFTACGPAAEAASQTLQAALKVFADTLTGNSRLK